MSYQLRYSSSARHALKRLPRETALKFITELEELAEEDEPVLRLKRLQGSGNPTFCLLRIGQYRAVMSIIEGVMIIHVVEEGHRSGIYRQF